MSPAEILERATVEGVSVALSSIGHNQGNRRPVSR